MVDVEHKVLSAIKNNLSNIDGYLKDKKKIKALMKEQLKIDTWTDEDRMLLFQKIAEEVLTNYDINEFILAIKEFKFNADYNDSDIYLFGAVVERLFDFMQHVYDLYLLDQIYFLLAFCSKDFILDPNNIRKPLKTGSYLETTNFDVSLMQLSMLGNVDKVYIHFYYNEVYYLDSIDNLFAQKSFLYKKAYLNETLSKILCEIEDNQFVTNLFFTLNGKLYPIRNKKKTPTGIKKDRRQLKLKGF